MPLLRIESLEVAYRQTQVVWGVDLEVGEGEIVALVGANGSGKSTILRAVSGLLPVIAGGINFDGTPIANLHPDDIVRLGIAHVPEGRRVFSGMTVRENLLMGAYSRSDRGDVGADLERVFALFPALRERQRQLAGTLSGGQQQMCAVGRALMARPRLLLVDELSLGLDPLMVTTLFQAVRDLNDAGMTFLVIEQDVVLVLQNAHRGYVMDAGRVDLAGDARELLATERLRKAYLGI